MSKFIDLEYGFMMDEETKEVYRLKGTEMEESSPADYERFVKWQGKRAGLWNDAVEVTKVDDDSITDDDSGKLFSIEEGIVYVYVVNEDNDGSDSYSMIEIKNLEDLQYSGLSSRSRLLIMKLLTWVEDFIQDNEWHGSLQELNGSMYKTSYKIGASVQFCSIKKVTQGIPVKSKKKSVSAMLDF